MRLAYLRRLQLPSRIALLFGLGALSAAGAQAHTSGAPSATPKPTSQTETMAFAELALSNESGRLCVVEGSGAAEELRFADTAEAQRLLQLLEQHAVTTAGVRLDRIILAGGGGTGFSWSQSQRIDTQRADNPPKTSDPRTASPNSTRLPRHTGVSRSGDAAVPENKK